jgi:signal transduction histidine kinase
MAYPILARVYPFKLIVTAYLLIGLLPYSHVVHAQAIHAKPVDEPEIRTEGNTDTIAIMEKLTVAQKIFEIFPDSAWTLAADALRRSTFIHFPTGIAKANNVMGRVVQNQGKYDSSIFYFTRGLISAQKTKLPLAAYYNNIANSYFFLGSYRNSMESYSQALAQQKDRNTPRDSCQIFLNIALIWVRLGATEQARAYLDQTAPIAIRTRDTLMQISLLTMQGDLLLSKGEDPKAIVPLKQALALAKETGNEGSAVEILNELTHIYLRLKEVDRAMLYVNDAFSILNKYPGSYNYHRYHTQHNLGLVYMFLNNYKLAEKILVATYKVASETRLNDLILHMEPDLAATYSKNGKNDLAYQHMQHYAQLKDSILEKERKSMLDLWQQNILSDKDKMLLAQKLDLVKKDKKLAIKNILILSIVAVAVLLCFVFVSWIRGYRRKQKLQQEQVSRMEQGMEIGRLKAQVKGEEQERNRLALDLHDGIASQLWAIKLNVEHMRKLPLSEYNSKIDMIYQQLEDTTMQVRKTAHNLMPDLLLDCGLSPALTSLCNKISNASDLDINFQEYGIIPRMNEEIELSLYRMVQELIQNALKHAVKATQLLIQLSCTNNLLNITVEDNGEGFPGESRSKKGIGLENIAKRATVLGGHFDIQSKQGSGTTAYLEFELANLL